MKRRILVMLLVVGLVGTVFLGSKAEAAAKITPSLTFSSSKAVCSVRVVDFGKSINARMELWCGSTLVDSWSGTGTSSLTLNGSHSGCISGRTYTLKVNGTTNGTAFTERTVSAVCP